MERGLCHHYHKYPTLQNVNKKKIVKLQQCPSAQSKHALDANPMISVSITSKQSHSQESWHFKQRVGSQKKPRDPGNEVNFETPESVFSILYVDILYFQYQYLVIYLSTSFPGHFFLQDRAAFFLVKSDMKVRSPGMRLIYEFVTK